MRKLILTSMFAGIYAAMLAAQTPATGQQQSQSTGTTTITGCLYNERDVPGRTPNVAEQAGLGEDYIIAGAEGTAAAGKMYKVEDIDDERLRSFVGKRVELTGNIDDDDDDDAQRTPAGTSGTADSSVGPDRIELPEFEATAIRAAEGNCPATPSGAAMSGAAATSGIAASGSDARTQSATGTSGTQSATASETEAQTHTAPVTETPSHPAAQPQPQPQPQPQGQPQPQTQTPPPQPPVTKAPTYPQTSPAPEPTVTLTGCLYRERDVPGRTPNVAERAGMLEDYILADASVQGASSATGTAGTAGTSGTAPAIGKMFKVEHVADEKLAQFVGKRVEVTGKIDVEADDMKQAGTAGTAGSTEDRSAGPDRINLPEFEAATIREVAGTCPATPQK